MEERAAEQERQGEAWTPEEDRKLYEGFLAGKTGPSLASEHGRSNGAIRSRLRRLGLVTEDGELVSPPPEFCPPGRTDRASRRPDAIFAVTTGDGWQVELRSNRPLTHELIERLAVMLTAAV